MARFARGRGQLFRRKKNGKFVGNYFFKLDGKPKNTGTTDERDAERQRAIILGKDALGEPISQLPKMNEVFGLLEAEYRAEDRGTLHTLLVRLKQLKPFFGKRDAQTLTTATLKRYRDKRENEYREHSNEKIKPATVNKELQVVRAALNLAKAERKITQVPSFRGVWLAENNVRQRQVKPAEYLHLREALPTLLRRLLVLGYHNRMESVGDA